MPTGKVGDWFDSFDIFDSFINSSSEQEQENAQTESLDIWRDVYGGMPSSYDLQGLGMYGQQAPQEYIDQYLAEQGLVPGSGGGSPGSRGGKTDEAAVLRPGEAAPEGTRATGGRDPVMPDGARGQRIEDATRAAQEQWVQEQIANDPLFGWGVNEESSLASAAADPESIQAQRDMIAQMQGIVDGGGYTNAERSQMQLAQRDAANFERSQRLAAQENARARGMGGGGMELMGALSAQQGGANRANDWANQTAIAAQQRMLQAMQMRGDMGTQMRGQSFNEDAARRTAADMWNQYQTGLIRDRQDQAGAAAQQVYQNQLTGAAGMTGQLGDWSAYQNELENRPGEQRRETANTFASFFGGKMGGGGASGGQGGGG
jgi:hypothetical protein